MKSALLLLSVVLLSACHVSFNNTVEGNTKIKKDQRDISGFTAVEVAGPFQVTIQQGDTYSVTIEADDNLLPYIEAKKENNTLIISERNNYSLRGTQGLQVTIQMPDITGLSVAGSGLIKSAAILTSDNKIAMNIGGSGKIQAELDAPEVDLEIGGSGTATLSGKTRKMDIIIGGSGDCLSEALKSEECDVTIGGSGTAKVYASDKLNVTIGGSGDVYYAGQPTISQSIGGSGKIRPL